MADVRSFKPEVVIKLIT